MGLKRSSRIRGSRSGGVSDVKETRMKREGREPEQERETRASRERAPSHVTEQEKKQSRRERPEHPQRERERVSTESCDRAARVGWQCQLSLFPPSLSFSLHSDTRGALSQSGCSVYVSLSLSLCENV